jgi:hypothetical protein
MGTRLEPRCLRDQGSEPAKILDAFFSRHRVLIYLARLVKHHRQGRSRQSEIVYVPSDTSQNAVALSRQCKGAELSSRASDTWLGPT